MNKNMNINCDYCKYYEWYYDHCRRWNCEIDAREVHSCFKARPSNTDGQYYRIVYFHRNGTFCGLSIKKQSEVDIVDLIKRYSWPLIEIYKCNAKGNNYSRRRVYPPR